MVASRSEHLPEIDCAKGVAILAVILIHSKLFAGTAVDEVAINRAVPVFLVLFGVTSELWWRRDKPMADKFREWYVGRFTRLLPPYWAMVATWWLLAAILVGASPSNRGAEMAVSFLGVFPWMGTSWFVTMILQFVLLFPILHLAVRRSPPPVALAFAIASSALSIWYVWDVIRLGRHLFGYPAIPSDLYYFFVFAPRVLFHVVCGMLLIRWIGRIRLWVTLLAAALVAVAPFFSHLARTLPQDPFVALQYEQLVLVAVDLPLTVALLGFFRAVPVPRSAVAFLRWCGKSSWGIYLGHVLLHDALLLSGRALEKGDFPQRALYAVVLFACGCTLALAGGAARSFIAKRWESLTPGKAA